MQALLAELASVLDKQADLFGVMRSLLEEEHAALRSRKPEEVLAFVRRKETILLQIRTLEESRRLICARLADRWHTPASSLTLGKILRCADAESAHRLSQVQARLGACVKDLQESNTRNARVCQSGILAVQRIMQSVSEANTESAAGCRNPANPGKGKAGVSRAMRAYGNLA